MAVLPAPLDRRFEAVVLVGPAPPPEGDGLVLVVADEDGVDAALAELWERGIGPRDVLVLVDGTDEQVVVGAARTAVVACAPDVPAVLEDQARRRRDGELPEVHPEPGWALDLGGFDAETERVHEALLAVGDGRVGVTGAPVAQHPSARPSVLVAGVYDGDGSDSRLLSAPVALRLPYDLPAEPRVRRRLDLRTGVLREDELTEAGGVAAVRFAALHRPGTVVLRARCPSDTGEAALLPPLDEQAHDEGTSDGCRWMRVTAPSGGVAAAVVATTRDLPEGCVQDRVAAYVGDADELPPAALAVAAARSASAVGFEQLLDEQRRTWAGRWQDADVTIELDADLQLSTRLALFHLMGSVADEGEAAVGARGVTGHGYSGHVFWDADTFVLPFLAATHPASARAMLEYRIRRLPPAMAAARTQSRDGARYPWESARTGQDVTPSTAYDRGGRLIPVRTGTHELHIVAEVAWAASCYVDWSGDRDFAGGAGLRLLVETARYWASRVELDADRTAHLRGVIGPDEYHEDVDDDAFTNVMARWNLRRAADAVDDPTTDRAGVGPAEVARWRDLAAALVDGWDPETGRHEQFRGFAQLEPLVIAEVAPRRPIAADVLMGRERIQASQVVKQPAVLMLHHLVPDELRPGSLRTDLAYYEPRTAHGSSLSPGVHASLLARAGKLERALQALEITAHVDLHDLTGSTASGVHLATAGALWQALVLGFAGLRPTRDRLVVDPHVPPAWGELGVQVRYRGSRVRLRCSTDQARLESQTPVEAEVGGTPVVVGPEGLQLRRTDDGWEVA